MIAASLTCAHCRDNHARIPIARSSALLVIVHVGPISYYVDSAGRLHRFVKKYQSYASRSCKNPQL
jgi:hypothetical protein